MRKSSSRFPVEIVNGCFTVEKPELATMLKTVTGAEQPKVMIVADQNVVQRVSGLGKAIGAYFQHYGIVLAGAPEVLSGGEKAKTLGFEPVARIIASSVAAGIGANDAILAIGGGTVLDLAGFAAALVRGGVKLVRLPTTPAAIFGSALAETAALDMTAHKDVVRTRSMPAGVVVDTRLAATVLDGVWSGGYAEAIRIALVSDAKLVKRLAKDAAAFKRRQDGLLEEIARDVLAISEKKGLTAFALWSAERLETMSGYKLPHGYAVAIGILLDAMYAREKGFLADADFDLVRQALEDCGAMEGAAHSRHLLGQTDEVLKGLEELRLATGSGAIVVPAGLGKSQVEEKPDVATIKAALNLIK